MFILLLVVMLKGIHLNSVEVGFPLSLLSLRSLEATLLITEPADVLQDGNNEFYHSQ